MEEKPLFGGARAMSAHGPHFALDPDDNRTALEVYLTPLQTRLLRSLVASFEAGEIDSRMWPRSHRKALKNAVVAMNEAEDAKVKEYGRVG